MRQVFPTSTVPVSFFAVGEVCKHSSWVEDEEFLNGFEEDLMGPNLHLNVPHSVQDMDEHICWVNLVYTCFKRLVPLYVCQRVEFFMGKTLAHV